VVSSEQDGRERERGVSVVAGGVGRARERAMLCEMRRGSECGHWRGSKKGVGRVGGCRGREIRRRAQVHTCRSTASAEGAELTGQAHDGERERKGARGAMARRLVIRACETERERARGGEKLAPTDRPH
jgi:hypothetical protein